ncbi:MAG: ATP-binding protein [Spirulina sp.]
MRQKQGQVPGHSDYTPTLVVCPAGDRVEIRIRDKGCDIEPEMRDKILAPNPREQASDWAVPHPRYIVKQHRDTLTFDGQINEFTEFVVRLPYQYPYPS